MVEYACIKVGKDFVYNNKSKTKPLDQYDNLLNNMAEEGWILSHIDHLNVAIPPGCLAGLFGAKPTYKQESFYIFMREV